MLEVALLSAAGCVLLAAATHRLRREAGADRPGERRALRLGGWALLLSALTASGGGLGGEWAVRFAGGFSAGGLAAVLALSRWPATVLAPVRWCVAMRRGAGAR